jgi:hypothetical protein
MIGDVVAGRLTHARWILMPACVSDLWHLAQASAQVARSLHGRTADFDRHLIRNQPSPLIVPRREAAGTTVEI